MSNFEEIKKKILQIDGVQGVSIENGQILVFSDTLSTSEIDGVPVKCLKAGGKAHTMEMKPQYADLVEVRREKWRPIPGGVSIADAYNTAGTAGMKVYYKGEPVVLSNAHIFTKVGLPVVQPSPSDGGDLRDDYVGTVVYASDIGKSETGIINEIDAALAYSDVKLADNILTEGVITDYYKENPHILQSISKSGRDGTTTGRVIARNGTFKISYADLGDAMFDNVIVTTAMARPGSSGSIGVSNHKAVGLLFAGSDSVTLYIPFYKVVEKLGITLE